MTAVKQLAQAVDRMVKEYFPAPEVDEFLTHCITVLTGLVGGVEPTDRKDGE